ncbi:hypothetical protein Bhyg_03208, partial [Pseudolycoriella hygida]
MISNIAKECRKLYETEINKLNTNEDALCTQLAYNTVFIIEIHSVVCEEHQPTTNVRKLENKPIATHIQTK